MVGTAAHENGINIVCTRLAHNGTLLVEFTDAQDEIRIKKYLAQHPERDFVEFITFAPKGYYRELLILKTGLYIHDKEKTLGELIEQIFAALVEHIGDEKKGIKTLLVVDQNDLAILVDLARDSRVRLVHPDNPTFGFSQIPPTSHRTFYIRCSDVSSFPYTLPTQHILFSHFLALTSPEAGGGRIYALINQLLTEVARLIYRVQKNLAAK